mmetsp:Transcript_11017/g.19971  ORF Transcript_11017/g.19971 Transcript_11017/m.19971 type:complete len:106 (-) Transcript_11017:232-549(-)
MIVKILTKLVVTNRAVSTVRFLSVYDNGVPTKSMTAIQCDSFLRLIKTNRTTSLKQIFHIGLIELTDGRIFLVLVQWWSIGFWKLGTTKTSLLPQTLQGHSSWIY